MSILSRNPGQRLMKNFDEIQREARKGDYSAVAEIVQKSVDLVKKVVSGKRVDHHNIQKVFSDLLENRERLNDREQRRRDREAKSVAA